MSDVTHLLGPAQPKQQNRLLAAMQAPQLGQQAYELIGDVGNTQNAGDMKLGRHKRSKELVTMKCIKQSSGKIRQLACNLHLSAHAVQGKASGIGHQFSHACYQVITLCLHIGCRRAP